jgi:hypothetical protein
MTILFDRCDLGSRRRAVQQFVGSALTVTEIGIFDDWQNGKAAIASAYVERKTASPGTPAPVANIECQFVCIERGGRE